MERYRFGAIFSLLMVFAFSVMVLVTELPLLSPELRLLYGITKMLISGSGVAIAYWLYRDFSSENANTAAAVMLLVYCCHGQYFRPAYYFALLQMLTLISFIFPISKKRFRIISISGGICFAIITRITWQHFQTIGAVVTLTDVMQVIFGSLLITLTCNTFFSSERNMREDYIQRFAQIGIQTARTVHDLKGLISAPKLYVQILENKYAGNIHPEAVEILGLLSRDLESLQSVLKELNQLSVTNPIETEFVKISDIAISLQLLLRKKLIGIDLDCTTEIQIRYPRATLTSILLNLVLNSADAFHEKSASERFIQISAEKNTLIVTDNAGGFNAQVLRDLQRKHFVPRLSESGMGLLFVTDEMNKAGGDARFDNIQSGSEVRLTFPAKLVKS